PSERHVQISGCASIQAREANRGAGLLALLFLAAPAIFTFGQTQPNSRVNGQMHGPQRTTTSPLQHAEELIQQGHLDEAKKVIEEQIYENPSSVEAYNLEGIIYTDEKDYAQAADAFQQALK